MTNGEVGELAALFGWSFLAATILPLGSEPALAVIAAKRDLVVAPVIVATIGNYLGACTTYWLALEASQRLARSELSGRAGRAAWYVQRYGAPALLLSWVPVIGDAIVAAAGAARMKFMPFSFYTAAGKLARYIAVAMVARGLF